MEDEPWDEIMGPSKDHLSTMFTEDRPQPAATPVRSAGLSARAPPRNMFAKMPDRWSQHESTPDEARSATQRAVASAAEQAAYRDAIEDSDDEVGPQLDYNRIRENARRILDDEPTASTASSSTSFGVVRTATGELTAGPTRQPKALKGLSFASSRKNVGRKFRDLDILQNTAAQTQANAEYADDDNVVDVIGMEQRFAASRPADDDSKNWSSRYSVDNTLLALSGGSLSSQSKYLDQMDQQHERQTARNLFGKTTNVFGSSGFSFRKKNVYGKQGVTMPTQNLKTVWMDLDSSPSTAPAKSWQEQLAAKRRQRRRCILLFALIFGLVVAASTSIHVKGKQAQQEEVVETTVNLLTFYATSDTPYSSHEEDHLTDELAKMRGYGAADFAVHLGNMQDPLKTTCSQEGYDNVRDILKESPYPMFVVPGIDDWRNCASPDDALYQWKKSFRHFSDNFDIDYEIMRQFNRDENWAIVVNDVLVMGVNLVTGDKATTDWTGHMALLDDNKEWVEAQSLIHKGQVRAIVVFGNARPGTESNIPFFNYFAQKMSGMGAPVLYMHANDDNGGVAQYKPFRSYRNIWAIQVQSGDKNPPLRVRVTNSVTKPFVIS